MISMFRKISASKCLVLNLSISVFLIGLAMVLLQLLYYLIKDGKVWVAESNKIIVISETVLISLTVVLGIYNILRLIREKRMQKR